MKYSKPNEPSIWKVLSVPAVAVIVMYGVFKITQGENAELSAKRLGLETRVESVQTADVNDVNNVVYDNKSNYGSIK